MTNGWKYKTKISIMVRLYCFSSTNRREWIKPVKLYMKFTVTMPYKKNSINDVCESNQKDKLLTEPSSCETNKFKKYGLYNKVILYSPMLHLQTIPGWWLTKSYSRQNSITKQWKMKRSWTFTTLTCMNTSWRCDVCKLYVWVSYQLK